MDLPKELYQIIFENCFLYEFENLRVVNKNLNEIITELKFFNEWIKIKASNLSMDLKSIISTKYVILGEYLFSKDKNFFNYDFELEYFDLENNKILNNLCENGHNKIIMHLIKNMRHQDKPFVFNYITQTALTYNNHNILDWIIDVENSTGIFYFQNLFEEACHFGNLKTVLWVRAKSANNCVINISGDRYKPFLFACCGNQPESVKWLIEEKCIPNSNVKDNDFLNNCNYVFRIVCENGYIEIAELLLKLGVIDIHVPLPDCDESMLENMLDICPDPDNYSCDIITIACRSGKFETLNWLISKGVDIEIESNIIPFEIACNGGFTEIVKFFLERMINSNFKKENIKDLCDYVYNQSCEYVYPDMLKMLIELMRNSNIGINYFYECNNDFCVACQDNDLEKAKLLFETGIINIHAFDCGINALVFACENGYIEIVKYLFFISTNSKIGMIDIHFNDDYAFCIACSNGHREIAKLIINYGKRMRSPIDKKIVEWHYAADAYYYGDQWKI